MRASARGFFFIVVLTAVSAPRTPAVAISTLSGDAESPAADLDGDGLPDAWERQFGLDPALADGDDGPDGDPDGDGLTTYLEWLNGGHPRGWHRQYLAEGAGWPQFETRLAIVQPRGAQPAHVLLTFLNSDATVARIPVEVPGERQVTVDCSRLAGVTWSAFSVLAESDTEIVVTRTMSWGGPLGGSHLETATSAPREHWYFAEGATHSGFQLFYLLQNPGDAAVQVEATFLRPSPLPQMQQTLTLAPRSRTNIWVNRDVAMAPTDVSARFHASGPIVIERAMYRTNPQTGSFGAGHASLGAPGPATEWFFAEGATGDVFDAFLLLANFSPVASLVEVHFLLPGGEVLTLPYEVPAFSRRTVEVEKAHPRLAATDFSMRVVAVTGEVVAERAMWWQGSWHSWYEGHSASASPAPALSWALAEGQVGASWQQANAYILVANPSATAARVGVTLLPDGDGEEDSREFIVAAGARTTVSVFDHFPAFRERRFGARVDSLASPGAPAVPVVVEQAVYNSGARWWSEGGSAQATDVTPLVAPLADVALVVGSTSEPLDVRSTLALPEGTVLSAASDSPAVSVSLDDATGLLTLAAGPDAAAARVTVTAMPPGGEPQAMRFRVSLVDIDDGEIVEGLAHRFDPMTQPILEELRTREGLGAVVASGATEFDRMLLLKDWVAAQWPKGNPDPYPPWNALTILDWIRSGMTGGFCAQYAQVYLQGLASLGYTARYIGIGLVDNPYAHYLTEVWSNQYEKWIVLDPDFNVHYVRDGVPLSALEVHEAFVAGAADEVTLVLGSHRDGHPDPYAYPARGLEFYYYLLFHVKADHLTDASNPFDFRDLVVWSDPSTVPWELSDAPSPFAKVPLAPWAVTSAVTAYPKLNQVEIEPVLRGAGRLELRLTHNVVDFDHYAIDVEGGGSVQHEGDLLEWSLGVGENRLTVRGVNLRGVAGPPATVRTVFAP